MLDFLFSLLLDTILYSVASGVGGILSGPLIPPSETNRPDPHPAVYATAIVVGIMFGGMTVHLLPSRILPPFGVRGLSLVLAPLIVGFVVDRISDVWYGMERPRPVCLRFSCAALFALGAAATRFILQALPG